MYTEKPLDITFPPDATANRDSASWFFQKNEKVIPKNNNNNETFNKSYQESNFYVSTCSLTLGAAQRGVADTRVLVITKVEEGAAVVSI